MIKLLDNIQNWTQNGPYATYKMQEWEFPETEELLGATGPAGLVELTGFDLPGDMTPEDWALEYGAYLTPYDWMTENILGSSYKSKLGASYGGMGNLYGAYLKSGATGFGQSYAAEQGISSEVESIAASARQTTAGYRSQISQERQNWVNNLYDQFADLGQMGAFSDEDDG
jgi:hypothetical protein